MSLPMAAIIGVTPKAPKRVLVPPILFAWWAGPAMAFPFGLWKPAHLAFVLALLQVLLALAVWYFAPNLSGTRRTLPIALARHAGIFVEILARCGPGDRLVVPSCCGE